MSRADHGMSQNFQMAEALVKNPICSKCGEEARPNALFCFACGGEIEGIDTAPDDDVSNAWFRDDIVDERTSGEADEEGALDGKAEQKSESKEDADLEEPEAVKSKPVKVKGEEASETDEELQSAKDKRGALKSAAELRRRPKPVRSKQIEVVWKERTDSPNVVFLVFGLVLVAISAGLLFLAFYLK